MHELQNINQNLILPFLANISKTLEKNNYILLTKAVEYAVYQELPNIPKYLIAPIITKLTKTISTLQNQKIENFKSEKEAQNFFKTHYSDQLNIADRNLISQEYSNMVYKAYDLCKYDKKIIYDGTELFFNITYIISTYKSHRKAYIKWHKLKQIRQNAGENNINISHNTNNTISNQLKFMYEPYKLYKNHSNTYNLSKEIDLNIIDSFKEDKYMMSRAINEISSIRYNIDNFKKQSEITAIQSFKSIQPYLNSDITVEKSDIINSWLTYIAFLYGRVNPSNIPKTKVSDYIKIITKATTDLPINIDKTTAYESKKLNKATFREFGIFNGTRLIEVTDNRRKITRSEESIKFTEDYIKNITSYLSKH